MADRYYTDPEYRKAVDDYLTGPRKFSKSKGAFRKFVKEDKAATVDTSSLAQKIKKVEKELSEDKIVTKTKPIPKSSFLDKLPDKILDLSIKHGDIIPEDQIVKYDSTTGLFSNKKRDIAFKHALQAREHNKIYEKYIPEIKAKNDYVKPTPKPFTKVKKPNPILKEKPVEITPFDYSLFRKQSTPEDKARSAALDRLGRKIIEDQKRARLEKEKNRKSGIFSLGGLL